MTSLLIGTYPADGAGTPAGRGEGIWRVELDDATGALTDARQVVELASPSFLAAADGRVHAVLEAGAGAVVTFDPRGDAWAPVARAESGGAFPCHLVVLPGGTALAVANYGSGTLGVVPLDAVGADAGADASEAPVVAWGHTGHGPRADRQESPHAHFAALAPGGRHLLVVDLGTDEIRRYALTDGGVEPAGIAATLPPGAGPRHLAFAAGHAYVAGELDARVHVLAWDEPTATGAWVDAVPAVVPARTDAPPTDAPVTDAPPTAAPAPAAPPNDAPPADAPAFPSHVAVDGGDLLLAVRGADVLTRYRVAPGGALVDGRSHPLGGSWPRHFAVVGRWTVVALERGHALVVVEPAGVVVARCALPSPACVVPLDLDGGPQPHGQALSDNGRRPA